MEQQDVVRFWGVLYIAAMLLIGEVELNLSPTVAELAKKLD